MYKQNRTEIKSITKYNNSSCFFCDSTDECLIPNRSQKVNNLTDNIECYTYLDLKSKSVKRGIIGDRNTYLCETDKKNCIKCVGNECNSIEITKSKLKCIQCSASDEECEWGFQETDATDCKLPLLRIDDQPQCFTKQINNEVYRGCTLDNMDLLKDCSSNNVKCESCDTNGCNNKHKAKCYQCDSRNSNEKECTNLIDDSFLMYCQQPNILYENRGCYYKFNSSYVKRGCYGDLSTEDEDECKNNGLNCIICDKGSCNNEDVQLNKLCVECDENNNINCRTNLSSIPSKPHESNEFKGCYLLYKPNGKISRGYAIDMSDNDFILCNSSTNDTCKICRDKDCNRKCKYMRI